MENRQCTETSQAKKETRLLLNTSDDTNIRPRKAPDGGWGWVIVVASFFVNLIADGVTFSFGVLFLEFQKEFEESKAVTAGIVSIFHAIPLISGPISSALIDRYGCRKMTIFGSILATIGFLISAVSRSLGLLYISFGIISGFGLSLCYVAAIVIVAYYFDQRRSFATGISVCGSGVGTVIFAPFTHFLIEFYGSWRPACVILAGIFLNMCVCGVLFKDIEQPGEHLTKVRRKSVRRATCENIGNGQYELTRQCSSSLNTLPMSPERELEEPLSTNNLLHLNSEIQDHSSLLKRTLGNPNKPILKNSCNINQTQSTAAPVRTRIRILDEKTPSTSTNLLHRLRIKRQSLTYRGAMLNISRYRLAASSCPNIYRNSILDECTDGSFSEIPQSFIKNYFVNCAHLASNFNFILLCASNFILYGWYDVMYVYLVDYAREIVTSTDSTFLISIIGFFNMFGEIIIGWMGDKSWANINIVYALFLVISGLSVCLVVAFKRFFVFALLASIFGFSISANYALTSPMIVELVSLEQFSHAYGILLLIQGVSNLIGPPFAGFLYDYTRQWIYVFVSAGLFISISGLVVLASCLPSQLNFRSNNRKNFSVDENCDSI